MVLEIVIPEAREGSVKDMVFSILVDSEEKTLTELHRELKRRYRKSVSFQAVIKAVNVLFSKKVIVRDKKVYSLSKDWIFETRGFFDRLYTEHFKVKKPMKKVEYGKEVTVYTVHNLLELDRLWNELLTNWAKGEVKDKRNCWKGRHAWWVIPRLQEEDILHDFMIKKEIKTYNIWTDNTPLDKLAIKYYFRKNEHAKVRTMLKEKKDSHIAAFGNNLIKFEIPHELSKKLEKIFQKTKKIEDLDAKRAIDLFKENIEIEFTVIKDRMLANKIKDEIVGYFSTSLQPTKP